jgi:hypothetical protein
MRNFKSYITAAAIGAMVLTSVSCQKSFYTKANNNPNSPKSVPNGTLLSGIEVSLGYIEGGDFSRFACMFTQQIVGYSRQSAAYFQYIFTNQDPETAWDNIYDDVMANSYQLMMQAQQGGNHEYYGMGEIMMAYGLMRTVDMWGNIPYSQAFRGVASPTPVYDVDKALYDTVRALCYRGINNMNPALDATDLYSPDPSNAKYDNLGSDVMYHGAGAQWVKFAHAILARLYIHQTKHSNVAMCDSALAHVALSFTSNADNALVTFGTASNNNAPWFQFDQQRGDISFYDNWFTNSGLTVFADSMSRTGDPRLILQMDSSAEINYADVALDGFGTGYGYSGQGNSPVDFIDYAELQFIGAEATLRSVGVGAVANNFYVNGINADISKLTTAEPGVITPAQIATFLAGPQGSILTLTAPQAIIQNAWQENLALYLNPESFTLWRRCNWNIIPVTGSAVPRRFLYPQSEINLNTANVPAATQYSPVVFWDN